MRTITQAALAVGVVGTMAIGTPISAKAQQTIFTGPRVGVEIIQRPHNRRQARYNRYYDHQPYAYQYYLGDGRYNTWQYSNPYNPAQSSGPSISYFGH